LSKEDSSTHQLLHAIDPPSKKGKGGVRGEEGRRKERMSSIGGK